MFTGKRFLVTGGSGFFGDYFLGYLLDRGATCINVDIVPSPRHHPRLAHSRTDIGNKEALAGVFRQHAPVDAVFHFAALLAHGRVDKAATWHSNVVGTSNVASLSKSFGVPRLVFTSTNCLWSEPVGRPIAEDTPPTLCEDYGRSKLEAERILLAQKDVRTAIVRTPTIIQAGRLGLLAILFEFIEAGKIVWTVGGGGNRYQFIAARDLADACVKSLGITHSQVFHVGSGDVPTLRESYEYVIRRAGSRSRVRSLPKGPAILAMKLAHLLRVSPLGPYHWKMIAEDFQFDTSRAREVLGWEPTLGNSEILLDAYEYFVANRTDIAERRDTSAHRQASPMGVIRLLKWLS